MTFCVRNCRCRFVPILRYVQSRFSYNSSSEASDENKYLKSYNYYKYPDIIVFSDLGVSIVRTSDLKYLKIPRTRTDEPSLTTPLPLSCGVHSFTLERTSYTRRSEAGIDVWGREGNNGSIIPLSGHRRRHCGETRQNERRRGRRARALDQHVIVDNRYVGDKRAAALSAG